MGVFPGCNTKTLKRQTWVFDSLGYCGWTESISHVRNTEALRFTLPPMASDRGSLETEINLPTAAMLLGGSVDVLERPSGLLHDVSGCHRDCGQGPALQARIDLFFVCAHFSCVFLFFFFSCLLVFFVFCFSVCLCLVDLLFFGRDLLTSLQMAPFLGFAGDSPGKDGWA